MNVEIIKIGNSKGVRIPSSILKQCGMKGAVNMEVEDGKLIVTPIREMRVGWEEAFKLMARDNNGQLLDSELADHSWDQEEWQW